MDRPPRGLLSPSRLVLWGALALLIALPLLWRTRGEEAALGEAATLSLLTPHNGAIRYELAHAFERSYLRRHGTRVRLDWRMPGGTSEIARYLEGEYVSAFAEHWKALGHAWNAEVERSFASAKVALAADPRQDSPAQQARRAFLASNVSCGIDLFFGGGAFDFIQQAGAGRLVDTGVVRAHPELFGEKGIPAMAGGEPYWDPGGRWIGVCLDSFGICSNRDRLHTLGVPEPPRRWTDLADPRYAHELALANPALSGSVNKAFEMLVQQQMLAAVTERTAPGARLAPAEETAAVAAGWNSAMRLLMRLGGNARYFSDASSKIALDVADGGAVAGVTIGLYGRFQSGFGRAEDGGPRLVYADAADGTSFGADPVGMLRGAPHPELAREFVEWLLTPEAQRLWNWKVGAPGGPERYALRRLSILPALSQPEAAPFRSDPAIDPYAASAGFQYHDKWTGALFRPLAFIVRVMCIDAHAELVEAWQALIRARFPPQAVAAFANVEAVDYQAASGPIREALSGDKIREVRLAKELSDRFRAQYARARDLAERGQ